MEVGKAERQDICCNRKTVAVLHDKPGTTACSMSKHALFSAAADCYTAMRLSLKRSKSSSRNQRSWSPYSRWDDGDPKLDKIYSSRALFCPAAEYFQKDSRDWAQRCSESEAADVLCDVLGSSGRGATPGGQRVGTKSRAPKSGVSILSSVVMLSVWRAEHARQQSLS